MRGKRGKDHGPRHINFREEAGENGEKERGPRSNLLKK